MSEWKPIETAPKDGTWIMLAGTTGQYETSINGEYGHDGPKMAICRYGGTKWRDQWDDYYGPQFPTHWMPLPEPPK